MNVVTCGSAPEREVESGYSSADIEGVVCVGRGVTGYCLVEHSLSLLGGGGKVTYIIHTCLNIAHTANILITFCDVSIRTIHTYDLVYL